MTDPTFIQTTGCCAAGAGLGCDAARGGRRSRVPGRGETGCAFRGAKRALQPIADVAHLVHGLSSCEAGAWEARPTGSSGPDLYRRGFTTAMTENDATRGGEGRLAAAIAGLVAAHDPRAVFVYQTCLPAMVGDDVAAVCRAAATRWSRPVVAVDAPGFAGSRVYGVHRAARVLADTVIGSREPGDPGPADVVLIGEFDLAGDARQVRGVLADLGIRVVAMVTGDGRFDDLAAAHRARAAVVFCSQGLGPLAGLMHQRFGVPVLPGNFYGPPAIAETVRALCRLLADQGAPGDLPRRAEELIGRRERQLAAAVDGLRRRLAGKRVLVLCGGVKAWALPALLRQAGLRVVGTAVGGASPEERARITEHVAADTMVFDDWRNDQVDQLLRSGAVDIVLGGGNSRFLALKAGVPWLEVNHERDFPLAGYGGTLALLTAIDRSLASPLWDLVRRSPPWEGLDVDGDKVIYLWARSCNNQ